jgi:hypothetical protein
MDHHKPSGDKINKVVKHIGIGDSIDCRVDGDTEEEDTGEVAEA